MLGILIAIVVGGLGGWIASMILGNDKRLGLLGNVVVGIIGAGLGNLLLAPIFGVAVDLTQPSWLGFGVAIGGALILLAVVNLFTSGRPKVN